MLKLIKGSLMVALAIALPMGVKAQASEEAGDTDSTVGKANYVGVKAGINFSKINNLIIKDKQVSGINYGIVYKHMFNQNWGLQFEPGYQEIGVKSDNPENKVKLDASYPILSALGNPNAGISYTSDSVYTFRQLSLPIMLSYYRTFGKMFVGLQAGIALNVTLKTSFKHYSLANSSDTVLTEFSESYNNPQLVLPEILGGIHIGYNITDKVQLGIAARYAKCLDGISYNNDNARYNNMSGTVMATYRLGK